jgi:hypothetical protein
MNNSNMSSYDQGFRDRSAGKVKPHLSESELISPHWVEYLRGWRDCDRQMTVNEYKEYEGKSLILE